MKAREAGDVVWLTASQPWGNDSINEFTERALPLRLVLAFTRSNGA